MTRRDTIKFRRGTAAEWTASEPQPGGEVLRLGEPGWEKDTGKLKIGDGVTPWNSLPYFGNGAIIDPEELQDLIGTGFFIEGNNIDINYDDNNDNLTIGTVLDPVFNKVQLDTSADPTLSEGQIGWNAAEGTLDLSLENDTNIHIGEHNFFRIRNETANTIFAGQTVYASDVHNNILIEATPYVADGSIREIRFMGLVLEDIPKNQKGYAINFGHVENLDTRGNGAVNGAQNLYAADEPAWIEGDILYVHPTIPGKLTKVEPKHSISAAIVLYVHQNNGRIFVRPTSYGHLDDNHDVDLTGLADNNLLVYNSSTDNWGPSTNFTYNEDTGQTTINTEGKNNSLRLIQASDTSFPRINLIHNRGALESQTPLQSGDIIGGIYFSTINSAETNSIGADILAYTNEGLSEYDHAPTLFRIGNRNKEGSMNYSYIYEDGTINPRYGAIINDNAKAEPFADNSRGTSLQVFNVANLSNNEASGGTLNWCLGIIDETSTVNTVIGSQSTAYITIPSGVTLTSGGLVGHNIDARRNTLQEDNGTLPTILGQSVAYGHSVSGSGTNPTTNLARGISIIPYAGKGTITTAYDLYLGDIVYNEVIDAEGTIKTGDGSITNRYGIVQGSADPNVLTGSLTVVGGLSAPTKIYALGTVSGNVSISYDIDKQIQTLTLNGTATNFIEGSGWPSTDSVDVLLEITVSSTTSVTWTIVDDWYNPVPSFVPGKYLVLLRSIGTTIQGHYIGEKTN